MLELVVTPDVRLHPSLARQAQEAARTVMRFLPEKFHVEANATLLLTGNPAIKQLNHNFRGINKATNVLSFPQFPPEQIKKLKQYAGPVYVGDIAIGYPYIVAEARKERKSLKNHLSHMVIHGLLHLFGYDHIISTEAEHMEQLETRIMAGLGLPDPYTAVNIKEPKRTQRPKAKSQRPKR